MVSAPGTYLLPPADRKLFVEQFEKDLPFFQLFFLLLSRCCRIKNVDLVWVERESGEADVRCLGMCKQALSQEASQLLGYLDQDPHPVFCKIISGYGAHERESCGVSDKAAEDLIRRTGRGQVYRCNFGLTDIAVPVMVNGEHIATLFTGQLLQDAPSPEAFVQIKKDVAHLRYLDTEQLEHAYWQVPVIPAAEVQTAAEVLEAFADFLGNSWLRLAEAAAERRRKDREVQLCRKEFAYLALDSRGSIHTRMDASYIRDLIRRIGFTRPPNRVLVVRLDDASRNEELGPPFEIQVAAALQSIEEVSERVDNVAGALLNKSEICVFCHDPKASGSLASQFYCQRLTSRIINAVNSRCEVRVRVGLGTVKDDWEHLAESYREATSALAGSDALIATYRKPQASFKKLTHNVEELCRSLENQHFNAARSAAMSLSALVSLQMGSNARDLTDAGLFFGSAMESMCAAARNLGCDKAAIASLRNGATDAVTRAPTIPDMQGAWLQFADQVLEEARWLSYGKCKKIVTRACRIIEQSIERGQPGDGLSMAVIAATLGVSVSHMSRTFKREVGQTFERYVMAKRVELAKRLLLDPLHNVSQVARRCGFSDPSYFARVFRKFAGCSPNAYCHDPARYGHADDIARASRAHNGC